MLSKRPPRDFLRLPAWLALGALILVCAACSGGPRRTGGARTAGLAPADTVSFAARLAAFMARDPVDRAEARAGVAAALAAWRGFEAMAANRLNRRERPFLYEGQPRDRRQSGYGLAVARDNLRAVVAADPSAVEAWAGLAHLGLEIGDLAGAKVQLENAASAAQARAAAGDTVAAAVALAIARDQAWVLRDLGLWEEGLVSVEAALARFPGDQDLVLAQGLLLAGAGRFAEAMGLAARMPALRVRDFSGQYSEGRNHRPSQYANQWIRAQAYAAQGDLELALHALGEDPDDPGRASMLGGGLLDSKLGRMSMPQQVRFWNDVGQLAEQAGSEAAVDYYTMAWRSRDYGGYYPSGLSANAPLVLGVPDERIPYFESFFGRHYLLGSRFAYVAAQMNRMALASADAPRRAAAAAALLNLDVLQRRNVRPEVCHALRGRIHYRLEEWVAARRHLAQARELIAAAGAVDARTSLLLGMLDLREERFASAALQFEESLAADPGQSLGWRMLGVAYANLDRHAEAVAAMDRALALEPRSMAGLYNRGLLRLQLRRCREAEADLALAARLDPDNAEVTRLLQMAATCGRAVEGPAVTVKAGGVANVRFEADTEQLVGQLADEMAGFFAVPAAELPARKQRLADIQEAAAAGRSGVLRTARAVLLSDLGRDREVQGLLSGAWPDGLRPPEDLLLLHADWRLGDTARLHGVVADALEGSLQSSNPFLWTLVVLEIRRDPARWGEDAEARVMARWTDQADVLSGSTIRYWAQSIAAELALARER